MTTSRVSAPMTVCFTNFSKLITIQFVPDPGSSNVLTLKFLSSLVLKGIIIDGERDISASLELFNRLLMGFILLSEATIVFKIKSSLFVYAKSLSFCTLLFTDFCNCQFSGPG